MHLKPCRHGRPICEFWSPDLRERHVILVVVHTVRKWVTDQATPVYKRVRARCGP